MAAARILVVGGGIAGLAVARALSRAGFSPEIAEREPMWGEAGTGVYLPGNAARALRALGLEEAVSERGFVIPRQRVADDRGRLLVEVDLAKLWDGVGPCLALHRADLHAVLLDGARDVPIRDGSRRPRAQRAGRPGRGGVRRRHGGRVRPRDRCGRNPQHGAAARLRRRRDRPARGTGGMALCHRCPPEITTWSVMLGDRTAFLTIPIGNGRVYCYCDVVSPADGGRHEDLGRLFAGFAEPVGSLLDWCLIGSSCTARRSRRSRSTPGCAAGWSSSGTRRTPPRPTWPRALRWRWKTRWCWRTACVGRRRSRQPCRRSRPAAARERTGSGRRRIAVTELATYPPRFETRFCGPSVEGSSDRTIDLCSTSPEVAVDARLRRGP